MADSCSFTSLCPLHTTCNVTYSVEEDNSNIFNTKKTDTVDNTSYNPAPGAKSYKSQSSCANIMNKLIPSLGTSSKVKTSNVYCWCVITLALWMDENMMTQWCSVQGTHLISQLAGLEEVCSLPSLICALPKQPPSLCSNTILREHGDLKSVILTLTALKTSFLVSLLFILSFHCGI